MAALDDLVARRAAKRAERLAGLHLKLPIPGAWDGDLVARYEARDVGDFGTEGSEDADLLARICTRLYLRDDDGTLKSIVDSDDRPVGFDGRLTALLGRADITVARDVVRYIIDEGNDIELSDHAMKVWAWLRDTSRDIPGSVTDERADHELEQPVRPTRGGVVSPPEPPAS